MFHNSSSLFLQVYYFFDGKSSLIWFQKGMEQKTVYEQLLIIMALISFIHLTKTIYNQSFKSFYFW